MKQTTLILSLVLLMLAVFSAIYIVTASLPAGRCEAYPGYPGPCPDAVQPPLEYAKPTLVAQCWIVNDTWSRDTYLQFTAVQDMPIVDYVFYWGRHVDHSKIEMQMTARIPPFQRTFFDNYIQFHNKRETLPGVYRLKWQGSHRVSSVYLSSGVEYQINQAYLQFQNGSYWPCYTAPCVVPLGETYPLIVDMGKPKNIGECLDRSTLVEKVRLPVIKR